MNRIVEFELAGKEYFLNFSVAAAEIISEEVGDLFEMDKILASKTTTEALIMITGMLETLINQGAAYKKIVEDTEVNTISQEELKVITGFADLGKIKSVILEAMVAGVKSTVETESIESDPKV